MDDRVTDLDTLRDVALEKGISIQSKTMKVKDYLTYAICDDDGEVVRVPKWRSKGTVKAATTGTKLGEDYCTEAVVALIERNQAELAQQRALAFGLNEEDLFFDASGLSDMTENNLAGKGEDNGTGIPHEEGVDDAGDYTADDTSRRSEDTDGSGEVEQGWPGTIENFAEGNSGVCWEYAHRLRKFQEVRQRVDQQRQEQSRRHEAGVRKALDSLDRLDGEIERAHDVYGKSFRLDREFADGFGARLNRVGAEVDRYDEVVTKIQDRTAVVLRLALWLAVTAVVVVGALVVCGVVLAGVLSALGVDAVLPALWARTWDATRWYAGLGRGHSRSRSHWGPRGWSRLGRDAPVGGAGRPAGAAQIGETHSPGRLKKHPRKDDCPHGDRLRNPRLGGMARVPGRQSRGVASQGGCGDCDTLTAPLQAGSKTPENVDGWRPCIAPHICHAVVVATVRDPLVPVETAYEGFAGTIKNPAVVGLLDDEIFEAIPNAAIRVLERDGVAHAVAVFDVKARGDPRVVGGPKLIPHRLVGFYPCRQGAGVWLPAYGQIMIENLHLLAPLSR